VIVLFMAGLLSFAALLATALLIERDCIIARRWDQPSHIIFAEVVVPAAVPYPKFSILPK